MNKEKTISILGAGESGVAAAILAKKQGWQVFVSDYGIIGDEYKEELQSNNIAWEEKGHSYEKLIQSNEIIKSPGIPDKAKIITQVKSKDIPVIGEIEFAWRYASGKIIGITGTNGKTTATLLTWHILQKAGLNAACAGNLGEAFSRKVLQNKYDYYVLEISSFQLDDIKDFQPDTGVILNITPDHLDRYDGEIDKYVNSKFRMLRNLNQNGIFIYNADDKLINDKLNQINELKKKKLSFSLYKKGLEGAFGNQESIEFKVYEQISSIDVSETNLKGRHNLQNIMAAGLIAVTEGINTRDIEKALADFRNQEHRMEWVDEIEGVEFINDSKATNVEACWYALDAVNKPLIWIAGGTDKGNDYTQLFELVKQNVRGLISLGIDNKSMENAFKDKVPRLITAGSMEEAVNKAWEMSLQNDVVLLSPCCASFDLFKNYKDRGDQFKQNVKKLKSLYQKN